MLGLVKSIFSSKQPQEYDRAALEKLERGCHIGFGFMPQVNLSGRRFEVTALGSYEFDNFQFISFTLTHGKDMVHMIPAEDQGESYVALSRHIMPDDQRDFFAADAIRDIIEFGEKELTLFETDRKFRGWVTSTYRVAIAHARGRKFRGDYRLRPLPEQGDLEEGFDYFLLVSANNEYAIEIERYDDGRMELYATVYRPATDIGQVTYPLKAHGKSVAQSGAAARPVEGEMATKVHGEIQGARIVRVWEEQPPDTANSNHAQPVAIEQPGVPAAVEPTRADIPTPAPEAKTVSAELPKEDIHAEEINADARAWRPSQPGDSAEVAKAALGEELAMEASLEHAAEKPKDRRARKKEQRAGRKLKHLLGPIRTDSATAVNGAAPGDGWLEKKAPETEKESLDVSVAATIVDSMPVAMEPAAISTVEEATKPVEMEKDHTPVVSDLPAAQEEDDTERFITEALSALSGAQPVRKQSGNGMAVPAVTSAVAETRQEAPAAETAVANASDQDMLIAKAWDRMTAEDVPAASVDMVEAENAETEEEGFTRMGVAELAEKQHQAVTEEELAKRATWPAGVDLAQELAKQAQEIAKRETVLESAHIAAPAAVDALACDIRVAGKIIDEALRNEMTLNHLIRKVVELPVTILEVVHIPFALSEDDLQRLAQRYGVDPADKDAIRERITKELAEFAGEA